MMQLYFGGGGCVTKLEAEMNPVATPCVMTQIQSGCVVLCTAINFCEVHQRAKSVAYRLVDVMPLPYRNSASPAPFYKIEFLISNFGEGNHKYSMFLSLFNAHSRHFSHVKS